MAPKSTLTFIATPKEFELTGAEKTRPITSPLPSYLAAVEQKLCTVPSASFLTLQCDGTLDAKVGNVIARVSTVNTINRALSWYSKKTKDRCRLQIVAHGFEGRLQLSADPVSPGDFNYINSDPDILGLLAWHIGSVQEVMLASCYVAARLAYGNAVNGRTLLFAISEIWRCKVRGASGPIDANWFGSDGWFGEGATSQPVGWTWRNGDTVRTKVAPLWRVRASDLLKRPNPPISGEFFPAISQPRSLAERAATARPLTAKEVGVLTAYFNAELDPQWIPRIADPEHELSFQYSGALQTRGYLVCAGKFLLIQDGDKMRALANGSHGDNERVAYAYSQLLSRLSFEQSNLAHAAE